MATNYDRVNDIISHYELNVVDTFQDASRLMQLVIGNYRILFFGGMKCQIKLKQQKCEMPQKLVLFSCYIPL